MNRDHDNIIEITKDEEWNRSFELELVNLGVAVEQASEMVDAIQSLTVSVPDEIRAQGPNAEALYRKAIANGMDGANLEAFVESNDFQRIVGVRNTLEQKAEEAGGWNNLKSDDIYGQLYLEKIALTEKIYVKDCVSSGTRVGVCKELYDKLPFKEDLTSREQIVNMMVAFETLMKTADEESNKEDYLVWKELYVLSLQCAKSWDRENSDTTLVDYASEKLDERGNNIEVGETKINIIGVQATEEIKYYTEAYKNGDITAEEAQAHISEIEDRYQSYYDQYVGTSSAGASSLNLEKNVNKIIDAINNDNIKKLNTSVDSLSDSQSWELYNLGGVETFALCIGNPLGCGLGSLSDNLENEEYVGAILDLASLGTRGALGTFVDQAENIYNSGGDPAAVSVASSVLGQMFPNFAPNTGVGSGIEIPKGFKETKEFGYQHGQKVYKKGNLYYSLDIDQHNGGVWKVFKKQGGKLERIGTADANLNIFKN